MIRIFIIICLIQLTLLACGPDCYDTNKSQKLEDFLNKKWKNDLIFNTNYQDIKSHYHGLGHSDDSVRTFKLDWMSHLKITDNLGLTSTLRVINKENKSNFYDKYGTGNDLNMIGSRDFNEIYFRALYLTYILPEINDYQHMFAFGTMPFQGGSFNNYKTGRPQEANGLSMLFDMPFDAITYVADISKLTNMDFFQIRVGYGEYMKFRDMYPQDETIANTPYGTTISFINFDMKHDNNIFKIEAYQTNWIFEDINIGTINALGFGYAYDRLNDEGYVMYGTVGIMQGIGSYNSYISNKMHENRDKLIEGYVQAGYPRDIATGYVDKNLSNITPEFVSQTTNLTIDDTGLNVGDKTTGWAFEIGAKKEFWWEEFDIYPYVGFEYFRSSKDWVSTTLRGFHRNGIDPLIKGEAIDLYTGIKFDNNKNLTLSWIHENRKWSPSAINDVVGINTTQTNRNILTSRDIIRLDFTWMFLGL